ncbi:response regulator [Rhodocyclus tenuis]|uniref:response regulator n=1 Tax=Rhodocyclus gracilis TaxID=2929842 RepID=UPI001298AEE3|nr:response regulator [Rhodocyclus gracilis]MRD72876.1 response regulator [Rhodocyclus gracilis]
MSIVKTVAPDVSINTKKSSATALRQLRRARVLNIVFALASIAGVALVVAFERFSVLQEEYLAANFDSVHSARTLLKTRSFLDMAAQELDDARGDPTHRVENINRAIGHLMLAENYADEGGNDGKERRRALFARIQSTRLAIENEQRSHAGQPATAPHQLDHVRELAAEAGINELESWGNLSALNNALANRMQQIRIFIIFFVALLLLILGGLAHMLMWTRRAEIDLRRAKLATEVIQQTTLDTSPMGIVYIDTSNMDDRRVSVVNQPMAKMFGYPIESMIGLKVGLLYAEPGTYERFSREKPPLLAAGSVVREEVLMRRRDGSHFWCSLSIKSIDPGDITRGVVWTCEDISERKEVERQLMQAREHAEAASRAKNEFLANISHELRSPFAGILGMLELLQRTPLDDSQRRYTRLAEDAALHMQVLVNDLLDLSRIESGRIFLDAAPFDLPRLLANIAEQYRERTESRGLAFVLDSHDVQVERLLGDPVRLRQIIENLLGNAIKFTRTGEIRLEATCVVSGKETARLQLRVIDTGIGVSPALHEQIFDKFVQVDPSTTRTQGGVGLGLAICRQLLNQMGGQIRVDSRPGEGSCFSVDVELPIASGPLGELLTTGGNTDGDLRQNLLLPSPTNLTPSVLRGVRVLLVDDQETTRVACAELLRDAGCEVCEAADGDAAVEQALRQKPALILMDCQMPGTDGYQATRRIRAAEAADARGEHTPIIALTAHATAADRAKCLASGMDDYLTKPVASALLLGRMAAFLASKRMAASDPAESATALPRQRPMATDGAAFCGTLLLVEDNPAIQEATRHLLEQAGCTVVAADDGEAALSALAAQEFDLVLMDCKLPTLDGWEATRRWRSHERQQRLAPTAIIALTAANDEETRERCAAAGMNGVLVKPFAGSQLISLLTCWLGESSAPPSSADEPTPPPPALPPA